MIEPNDDQLEQRVREFIQRIPRRRAGGAEGDAGSESVRGPFVQDGVRQTTLDTGEMGATVAPQAASVSPLASGGAGHPWRISVDNDGYLTVGPGSVNSLLPSNIFDSHLIGSSTYYVKVKCDTDGKTPNYLTIVLESSGVDASSLVYENVAPPTFYDLLGIVIGSFDGDGKFNGTIHQVRYNNISASAQIAMLVSTTPASIGDEPFVRWFRWVITE